MEHWNLRELGVEPQHPQVLHSTRGEARSIILALRAGEDLSEHQVHERGEPHSVRARSDARLLLVLAPWPGSGHPGARD